MLNQRSHPGAPRVIDNSPQPKTTRKSSAWQMEKLSEMYPYNGILLSSQKEQTTATGNRMDES